MSLLVGSEVGGCPLSREELFMFLLTLLVAGNETDAHPLVRDGHRPDEHPDQRAALVARAGRWCPARVEECLRWVTPGARLLPHGHRGHRRWPGPRSAQGDYLCMLYASANRDERIFGDDAARFDVRRPDQSGPPGLRLRRARVPRRQPGPPGGADLPRGAAGALSRLRGDGTGRAGALDDGRRRSGRCRWCWRRRRPVRGSGA